jgi:hypothetical protein
MPKARISGRRRLPECYSRRFKQPSHREEQDPLDSEGEPCYGGPVVGPPGRGRARRNGEQRSTGTRGGA